MHPIYEAHPSENAGCHSHGCRWGATISSSPIDDMTWLAEIIATLQNVSPYMFYNPLAFMAHILQATVYINATNIHFSWFSCVILQFCSVYCEWYSNSPLSPKNSPYASVMAIQNPRLTLNFSMKSRCISNIPVDEPTKNHGSSVLKGGKCKCCWWWHAPQVMIGGCPGAGSVKMSWYMLTGYS